MAEVTIECYKAKSGPGTNSGKSYTFDSWLGTNDTVVDGDKPTVLKSLLGSGLDMEKDYPKSSAGQTNLEVIPGLSGGGVGTNGQAAGDANGNGDDNNNNNPDNFGFGSGSANECNDGFTQFCNGESESGSGDQPKNQGARQEHVLGASAFAALVAVAGMLYL